MIRIALVGAGGKMGCRLTDNFLQHSEYAVDYLEVAPQGIENLRQRGVSVSDQAVIAEADVVILALPDVAIGALSEAMIPQMKPGALVLTLDPAAPLDGVIAHRDDLAYVIAHPCHPSVFNWEPTEATFRDFYGGISAKQSIVVALMHGSETDYALGERVAQDMYGPVKDTHRITLEQMAILEPAMVETLAQTCMEVVKEGYDKIVTLGVPEAAARDFVLGHLRIQIAVLFKEVNGTFSDAAYKISKRAKPILFREGWQRIFEMDDIREQVKDITARHKPTNSKTSMKTLLQERTYSLTLTILLVGVGASLFFPNTFPTFGNWSQLLLNLSIDTIVAVGMMVLLVAGVFDLSVGSVVAFSGGIAAYTLMHFGWPVPVAVLAALGFAGLIGAANGYLIAYQGINPMIQTLAMMGIVRGGTLLVSGAGIQNLPYWFNALAQSRLLGVQMPVWYMLLTVGVFGFLMNKTVFFRRYYYIGGNERAADLSGIRVRRMKLWGFVLTSLLAGVAGVLLASRLGTALPTAGRGLELRVITAVILGGASLAGGQGKIAGALLGALFMGLVSNVMVLARVSGYWQEIILGLILITAVWTDSLLRKQRV